MKKTQLHFNPDVMPLRDVKDTAKTVRSLMQTYQRLKDSGADNDEIIFELGLAALQFTDAYEVV